LFIHSRIKFYLFSAIQSFTLILTQTGINQQSINDIVSPQTDIFQNLQNLDVIDHSGLFDHASKFIGMYKNCRNITRLTLLVEERNIDHILSECLSYFTSLNEICFTAGLEKSRDVLKTIKNLTPNLKKLIVPNDVMNDAKQMFGNEVEIS